MLFARGGFYLGHLAGIPVYVHPSALVMLLLVALGGGGLPHIMAVLFVIFVGIVLHELGHGLTARAFGARDLTITLWAFGGVCHSEGTHHPRHRLLILAAGPAVSFLLALLCFLMQEALLGLRPDLLYRVVGDQYQHTLLGEILFYGTYLNLLWGIFNSVPIFPLDGGQFLYNLLVLFTRYESVARKLTLGVTVLCAFGFLLWRMQGPDGAYSLTNLNWFSVLLVIFLLHNAFTFLAR